MLHFHIKDNDLAAIDGFSATAAHDPLPVRYIVLTTTCGLYAGGLALEPGHADQEMVGGVSEGQSIKNIDCRLSRFKLPQIEGLEGRYVFYSVDIARIP